MTDILIFYDSPKMLNMVNIGSKWIKYVLKTQNMRIGKLIQNNLGQIFGYSNIFIGQNICRYFVGQIYLYICL